MKLGEGGEAFFVFETTENIPQSLQTSPLASPETSPLMGPTTSDLKEPDTLELDAGSSKPRRPINAVIHPQATDNGMRSSHRTTSTLQNPLIPPLAMLTPGSVSPEFPSARPASGDWSGTVLRPHSDDVLRYSARTIDRNDHESTDAEYGPLSERSQSPPPISSSEAVERAMVLSRELETVNIPSKVTNTGDLMLDMTGFKSSEEEMIRAEVVARNILSKELDGNYDIGSLFGFDAEGNLWIYSSEEARKAAMEKTMDSSLHHRHHSHNVAADAASDPGYQSDGSDITASPPIPSHRRATSDAGPIDMQTPPHTPTATGHSGDPNRNYAKTLRLTSEQLKDLKLKPGQNSMSFTVNRATCSANMYLWKHEIPVVISDIDGTITKSDALGHILNVIGRDWTHAGIAKLYSDIAANGYNIMYLTSRSVGQADTTRNYIASVVQEGCKIPPGPTILSPDRTMAALRREVYLRQPQVFKMATLRDIRNLYGPEGSPFYAGFGNRLTDQISYRTVDVPRNRIFTINSNSEVSLDLLTLNKLKMSYVNINEVVDHYFPPVSTLVTGGGEQYTDFMYWRDEPLPIDDFSDSDSDETDKAADAASQYADDDDDDANDALGDSYISHEGGESVMTDSVSDLRRISIETEDADDEEDVEYEDANDDADDDEDAYSEDEAYEIRNKTVTPMRERVEEDVNAELITGVGHLSLGQDIRK